jgi:hypothetical protein
MLPLATATLICHNAARPNAVRRRLQQFLKFAVGEGRLDVNKAGLEAIAHHCLRHENDPIFPSTHPGPIMVEASDSNFYERTLLPEVRAIRFYKGMLRFHSTFLIGPQVVKIQDDIELPLSNHRLNYECS